MGKDSNSSLDVGLSDDLYTIIFGHVLIMLLAMQKAPNKFDILLNLFSTLILTSSGAVLNGIYGSGVWFECLHNSFCSLNIKL